MRNEVRLHEKELRQNRKNTGKINNNISTPPLPNKQQPSF